MESGGQRRFDQIIWEAIQKSRDRSRFDAACRSAMAGKPRDEARKILIEQYHLRGEEPLGQPILDRRLDMLLSTGTPVDKARDLIDSTASLVGFGVRLKDLVRGVSTQNVRDMDRVQLHFTPDWHRTCQISLVDDAQSWLGEVKISGLIAFRDISSVAITMHATGHRGDGGAIAVSMGGRPAGTVPDDGAGPFWDVMDDEDSDELLTASTIALRSRDSDGAWRLDVGAPEKVRYWRFPFDTDSPDQDEGL